jgi:hypothetical protein
MGLFDNPLFYSITGIILGILLLIVGAIMLSSNGDFVTIEAIIDDADCAGVGTYTCILKVIYQMNNTEYKNKISSTSTTKYVKGQTIKLDVSKSDPNNSNVHLEKSNIGAGLSIACGGIVFLTSVGFTIKYIL